MLYLNNYLEIEIKNLEKLIKQNYDIIIDKIEKNEESTDGNVFIINSLNKKYVVKVYDNLNHVNSIIELYDKINNKVYVSKIIDNNNNKKYLKIDNDKYVVILSFLEGKQICEQYKNIPENVASEIGVQLRKIHNLTKDIKNRFKKMPFGTNDSIDRNSILHFDLTRSNILCYGEKNDKIGFIDFDDAKFGKSICDVAIAASNLFFSKTRGVDFNGLKTFINSYYKDDDELKQKELPFLKQYAINWIDYIMDGNEFDTSTIESFEIRKELLEKYMNIELFDI